jgi:quinol monooxygenase YgiN
MKIFFMNKMNAAIKWQGRVVKKLLVSVWVLFLTIFFQHRVMAQEDKKMYRIARITVDPLQLDKYKAALQEQMAAAIRVEPGVLSYQAVADKKDPAHITILEIYADTAAYQAHIQTTHFRKYKDTVKDMVKQLELVDVSLVAFAKKPDR